MSSFNHNTHLKPNIGNNEPYNLLDPDICVPDSSDNPLATLLLGGMLLFMLIRGYGATILIGSTSLFLYILFKIYCLTAPRD